MLFLNPWSYRYLVQTSFYTSFCTRAVIMLFRMIHNNNIDAIIIRKSIESWIYILLNIYYWDQVSREFSHCKHFIEWFVILGRDVYRYTRTFEISVRYQPAHVASRSGGAQNPCPSAISAAFAMIWHEISPSASCSVTHVRYALNRSWCNIVITGEERGNAGMLYRYAELLLMIS